MKLTPKNKNERVLRPIHPNAGLQKEYERRLIALLTEMDRSVKYWLAVEFKRNPPAVAILAQDELSATALRRMMRELSKRWLSRFDGAAKNLADYFAAAVSKRSDAALKKILKDGGISVEWRMTAAQRDVLAASVEENVALIRNLPEHYLLSVQEAVARSVTTGRDLKQLSDDLERHFGIAKKRAQLIARDQNNKINATLTRARQLELGATEAIWRHSHGGKKPRSTHVKAGQDQVRYNIAEGWHDPDPRVNRKILPGELVNCRCVSRTIIPGWGTGPGRA